MILGILWILEVKICSICIFYIFIFYNFNTLFSITFCPSPHIIIYPFDLLSQLLNTLLKTITTKYEGGKKEPRGLCDASWSSLAMANELD